MKDITNLWVTSLKQNKEMRDWTQKTNMHNKQARQQSQTRHGSGKVR